MAQTAEVLDRRTERRIVRRNDVVEDLEFLVATGVHEGTELARRLGFTNEATMERYCYRHEIPLLHKKEPEMAFNARKVSNALAGATELDPALCDRARMVVLRELAGDPSVLDVLDMLGLAESEQQLAS